jgi:hypothetical protein
LIAASARTGNVKRPQLVRQPRVISRS